MKKLNQRISVVLAVSALCALAAPPAAIAVPRAASYGELASRIVRREAGLSKITLEIAPSEAAWQSRSSMRNEISFAGALRLALRSFLEDDRDTESPLAIAGGAEKLREAMNRPSASLRLLARSETPEGGQSVREHWVFQLNLPELSDHGFCAVVHRRGGALPYNYGFN